MLGRCRCLSDGALVSPFRLINSDRYSKKKFLRGSGFDYGYEFLLKEKWSEYGTDFTYYFNMLFIIILSFYINILTCAPFSKSMHNCWLKDKLLLQGGN